MKPVLLFLLSLCSLGAEAQELYVSTEPASNMAARSVGIRLAHKAWPREGHYRLAPEVMLGLTRNWMIHLEGSFAGYYTPGIRPESINTYVKYRFHSVDGVQSHFRMAAYARAAYSRNRGPFDDLSLGGDVSGLSAGLVVTQLLHKLALSGTAGVSKAYRTASEWSALQGEAYNYSLSAGYLLYPSSYTSYKQLNVNLYLELLGKSNPSLQHESVPLLERGDNLALAPALQFIIDSQTRIDAGFRFDLYNTGTRMGNMVMMRLEYNLFNAW